MKKPQLVLLIPLILVLGFVFKDKILSLFLEKDKPNVIVIQLEAFQNFVLKRDINGKEVTPNLNALIEQGMYFPNVYMQNGSGSTSDAEFMLNTGLYPLKPPLAASTGASNQKFDSLPRILKEEGYSTNTLHTNKVVFWNRKEFYSALGFENYYDKESFEEKDAIAFGSSDDVLYKGSVDILSKKPEPFYAHVIGMSSHYPFKIPAKLQELEVPNEIKDTMAGDYLVAANYADAALGRFIDDLKEKGMWENTVLVVYGDHMGLEPKFFKDEKEKQAIEYVMGRKYDVIDALNIPLIIAGAGIENKVVETVGGHMDILPTLTGLLGINIENKEIFGDNLLTVKDKIVGFRGHYVPEASFITPEVYYDSKFKTVTNLKTRKTEKAGDEFEKIKKQLLDEFAKSDKLIANLPPKDYTFGTEIKIFEKTNLYKEPNSDKKTTNTIEPQTLTAYEVREDSWYSVKIKDEIYWIKPKNPMVEVWSFIDVKEESTLYKEPDVNSKAMMKVSAQNLFVSKKWVGTGWYQVFTWAGKDVWVKVEEN